MNEAPHPGRFMTELDWLNLVNVLLIVAAAWVAIRFSEKFLPWLAKLVPRRKRLYVLALTPLLRLAIMTLAAVMAIPQLIEPSFKNLIAILGAAGLALGFAFKDYASSLIAGVVAIYEQPYRPGDWVEIDGAYGVVKSLGLRSLELVTPDDTAVTIPHLKIWQTNVFNSNAGHRHLLCVADFYLHPQHDTDRVREKLLDVARTSPFLQIDKPVAVVAAERPWWTHYRLKAYPVDAQDQFQFTTELTLRGKAALAQLGVSPAARMSPLPAVSSTPGSGKGADQHLTRPESSPCSNRQGETINK